MAKRRMGIIAFLLCFCMFLAPLTAQALTTTTATEPILPNQACSLSISYICNGITFSELPVKLYKIADVSADYQYTLATPFKDSKLSVNGIKNANEWNIIRSTLETYIIANKIPEDFKASTNLIGQADFESLPTGLYLATTEPIIKENFTYLFDSALVALPNLKVDGLWQYNVEINAKSQFLPPIDSDEKEEFKVLKLWKGDFSKSNRPENVEIEIFRNGTSFGTAILSEENHWTYSWSTEDNGSDWKVIEVNVPSGYVMTVEQKENTFILTNTSSEKTDTPSVPQTGDTTNILLYVIIMNISGIMLIVLGILRKRTNTQ